MTFPSMAGLWTNLPQVTNVEYTSVANSGDITFTIPVMCTTPRAKIEREPSFGKYIQWRTTFKIDPVVFNEAVNAYTYYNLSYDTLQNLTLDELDSLSINALSLYPKSKDSLLVDGILWQVCKTVDQSHLQNVYRLSCDYFEFTLALRDTVYFVQATCTGASATGARTVVNTVISPAIPAAIEPRSQRIDELFGAIVDPETFDIYLDNDISAANSPGIVKAGAMLQDQNNVLYEILEVNDREDLDKKTHCLCIKKL